MTLKVLVTGAGAVLGQGIIRSLQNSSLKPRIVSVDPNRYSAGLFWSDATHLVPFANDPLYLDRIREVLEIERPDAVLVGTDTELPFFAEHRLALEKEFATHIVVSSPPVIDIANDKYKTYQFLHGAGLDCPASCLPGQQDALIAQVGFPLVVKPCVGARSIGVSVVHNRGELENAIKGRDDVVLQECVGRDDSEYTASALVFDGKCSATIVMRRDLRDGNTYRAYVEAFPELNRMVARLGEVLDPYGPANFQFRVDGAGRAKVFEINARFSGTTPLRALAGFNEVEMCLRKILHGETIVQPEVENMTILRYWSETVVRPSQLAEVR
jgi:carbamoyl-phosphate synthase large subunit